jgi:glycosyltransferase involved in cell wall biosynthesis
VLRVLGLFENGDEGGRGGLRTGPPARSFGYGAQHLHGDGIQLIRVQPAHGRLHRKVRDVVEHRAGYPADRLVRSLRTAARADVVFAYLENHGTLPALLRARRTWPMRRTPLVVLSCWWAEELQSSGASTRERILRAAAGVDRILVLSSNQVGVFARYGIPEHRVTSLPFSVDADWYTPDPDVVRDRDVVAVGMDRGRDFDTLVAAARMLPAARFDIVTQSGRLDPSRMPRNVTLHPMVPMDEYRHWLRRARVVAVPTHELAYPTGQSVLLEASATGACVAVTRTPAMADYLREGVTALGLPLGDARGVAEVLGGALSDDELRRRIGSQARKAVEERYAYPGMWTRVREILHEVAARTD